MPPWGSARANLDHLPPELLQERRLSYRRSLDRQMALKAWYKSQQEDEHIRLDRPEATSFNSTCQWGIASPLRAQERAVFTEVVETASRRKREAQEQRDSERREEMERAAQCEDAIATEWRKRKQAQRTAGSALSDCWRSAAEDRRRRNAAERAATLQEEREVARRMAQGMAPGRRLRKECPHPPLTVR